jgi:outer membrane protein assembly factor BamB
VTYQIDVAHTGAQPGDTLSTPLCPRWSRDLGGPTSYALVAGSRVFVTVASSGAQILALDEHTGATLWGPVALGGTDPWSNAAYDNGQVFALNSSGTLYAFGESSATPAWTVALPGQTSFSSPPTALGGFVYVGGAGSGGTVYAVSETDGGVAWTQSVENGDHSSPAVSATGVYVSYACNQAYGFAPATGDPLWHFAGTCEGGGGKTVALFGGNVYTRDTEGDLVLDAVDGGQVGTYDATFTPAFSGSVGYYVASGVLQAIPVGSTTPSWSFGSTQEPVLTAPIVDGSLVVVGTASGVYALATNGGTVVSSSPLAGVLGPDEQNVTGPLAGLVAADGMLFVPTSTGIVAY